MAFIRFHISGLDEGDKASVWAESDGLRVGPLLVGNGYGRLDVSKEGKWVVKAEAEGYDVSPPFHEIELTKGGGIYVEFYFTKPG